jgi:hypothetical protein
MQGTLLGRPFGGVHLPDGNLLDLASGGLAALPRSATSQAHSEKVDNWYVSMAGTASDDLLRVDVSGNVDFFDRATLARTGGFSLTALPLVDQPSFWSDVKIAPDGQHVLAYWKQSYTQDEPVLAVFDRAGTVVQSVSPQGYDGFAYRNAFNWLPDGRFVFLANSTLYVDTLGVQALAPMPVTMPAGARGANGTLSVSPDGRQIAWTLSVDMPDAGGGDVARGLVFISNFDGSAMRQVTTLSDYARRFFGGQSHWNPVWSPDQQFIAFRVLFGAEGTGIILPGCEPVIVLPVNAANVPIDSVTDPDSEHFKAPAPGTEASSTVTSCFVNLSWLRSP